MEIYLIRHGETDYNKQRIIQGSGVDSSLNETGQAQGKAFYEAYKSTDFQTVITSKLKRTHQTVAGFIDAKLPWEQQEDINEMNWGIYEGQPGTPEMKAKYREMIEHWNQDNLDWRLEGGESAADLSKRISRFLEHLKTRKEDRILVCTHGRAMRGIITLMKGQHLREMENVAHANTGLYKVRLEGGKFEVLVENDTAHLS